MQIRRRRTSTPASRSNIFALFLITVLAAWGLLPSTGHAQHPTAVTSIVNSAQDTTLEVNHAGGLLMPGKFAHPPNYSAQNDSIPATGAGTRLMWYPEKAAFRAGRVNGAQWDANNIGEYSVAFGLDTRASGSKATAMGGLTTASGFYTTAMGQNAEAAHDNTFVWADGSNSQFNKFSSGADPNGSGVTGSQTFHVKATGGARFVTGGGTTYISGNSTGWSNTSTRSAKTDVSTVDPVQVLKAVQSMPISTWEYKDDSGEGEGVRHMGPMAEDFHGELPYELGNSENHINSINADGVALAAIKGLTRKVTKQKTTISELKADNEAIKERLAALEAGRTSTLAGLGGSAGLVLFGLLLGGLFGAGLLWRRQDG